MTKPTGRKPTGRPSTFTKAKASAICIRIASGQSLSTIAKDKNMPALHTMQNWLADFPGFLGDYTRAREQRYDAMAEECLEIADDARNDWMAKNDPDNPGYLANGEHIHRSRLRIDTRKWFLSKLAPKKYGDKVALTTDGATLEAMLQLIEDRKRAMIERRSPQGLLLEGSCVEIGADAEPQRSP